MALLTDATLQEAVDVFAACGSVRAAAKALGVERSTLRERLSSAARRGISTSVQKIEAMHGHAPEHDMTKVVPEPFIVKGVSSYYNKDGVLSGQWVKSALDDTKAEEAIRAAIEALAETIPRAVHKPAPFMVREQLCNLYTITDYHVGMKSWHMETGEDWDLDIAESTLSNAMHHLIEASPKAATAIVAQLGDFLHFDSLSPVTPTSQHLLDADSRYGKVVKVAVRILRNVIDKALEHHREVIVLMAEGNHDMASSVWLRHLFSLLYENEPRVKVLDSELPYYVHQHGKTMLAFHHGHLSKNHQLPLLFAAQFPEVWGLTKRRYCHTGHRHHVEEKEHSGMIVVQHPTLAAKDAYAARNGWLSERSISSITYHDQHGQVARNTVTPDML